MRGNLTDNMSKKTKTREISIVDKSGTFDVLFKRFSKDKKEKESYDFEGLALIRKLLSNEKARILHTIKASKPKSIYELAKILQRDFKSVNNEIKMLEKFGFIDLISEKSGERERLRPVVVVDSIQLNIQV